MRVDGHCMIEFVRDSDVSHSSSAWCRHLVIMYLYQPLPCYKKGIYQLVYPVRIQRQPPAP